MPSADKRSFRVNGKSLHCLLVAWHTLSIDIRSSSGSNDK